MTIQDALSSGIHRSDAEILLAFALGKDRTWILAHPDFMLSDEDERMVQAILNRRRAGEPVAYITGTKEFYGRTFVVHPHVLIPRPATERLIDITKDLFDGKKVPPIIEIDSGIVAWTNVWASLDDVRLIVDIGTGSGCIAVTLACELPHMRIIATDISDDAIIIAQKNSEIHHAADRIRFLQGRGLDPLTTINEPFLIVTNPPYIPDTMMLPKDVADFEPHEALFAGEKGMDVIAEMTKDARKNPQCRGFVMECRTEQAADLA